MALMMRYLSRALRRAPAEPHDHEPPLADTSEETGIGEQMEKEVDQFLEKLKNAGMEINEEMARIIEEERARISEVARDAAMEAENKAVISWRRSKAPVTTTVFCLSLLTIAMASGFAGSCLGIKFCFRQIFNEEDRGYLALGYALKYFVER